MVLTAYEEVQKAFPRTDARHRIEHFRAYAAYARPGSDTLDTQNFATNPWFSISVAVNRKTKYGSAVQPEEAISVMDAIRMQTIWAAFAGSQEKDKGSIEVGKLADLVIVSGDPLTVSHDRLADIQTDVTMIDGKIRYQRPGRGSIP